MVLVEARPAGDGSWKWRLLEDGGVLTANGRILEVGPFASLRQGYGRARVMEHGDAALMPGLVNGHAHLELSALAPLVHRVLAANDLEKTDFLGWLRTLLGVRDGLAGGIKEQEGEHAAARQQLERLSETGAALVVDIGNDPASRQIAGEGGNTLFFLELLGLSAAGSRAGLERLAELERLDGGMHCTGHAPYSTAPALLQGIKEQSLRHGLPFSIHLAESPPEVEFLQSGSGPFRGFLEERGVWDNSFPVPGLRPVHYLEHLGLLDEKTVCVHCVQVDAEELDLLAGRRARVCLCPGSNRFLGVGRAPLPGFLQRGLLPALGTDSLASNEALDLWREMKLLSSEHPGVHPETVLAMATIGGAAAFGLEGEFGSLLPGRRADILGVRLAPELRSGVGSSALCGFLATAGQQASVFWAEQGHSGGGNG